MPAQPELRVRLRKPLERSLRAGHPWVYRDALEPFLLACRRHGAGVFCLVKTSNAGGAEIQDLTLSDGHLLWHHVARLVDSGRMRPRGQAEIDRAKADGRWDRAYAGQADMEPPVDLAAALADSTRASQAFAGLSRSARYSVMHPVLTAPTEEARVGRIARAVARLEAGVEPPGVAPPD